MSLCVGIYCGPKGSPECWYSHNAFALQCFKCLCSISADIILCYVGAVRMIELYSSPSLFVFDFKRMFLTMLDSPYASCHGTPFDSIFDVTRMSTHTVFCQVFSAPVRRSCPIQLKVGIRLNSLGLALLYTCPCLPGLYSLIKSSIASTYALQFCAGLSFSQENTTHPPDHPRICYFHLSRHSLPSGTICRTHTTSIF